MDQEQEQFEQSDLSADANGQIFFEWDIPEFVEHERGGLWYLLAALIAIGLIIYSIWTANLWFALIILLAGFIFFLRQYNRPANLPFKIAEDGVLVSNQLFPYKDIDSFYIIYEPPMVKKLYFKLKTLNPDDMSIPLFDNNPLLIRQTLLQYLKEDLSKEQQTVSDVLESLFKL